VIDTLAEDGGPAATPPTLPDAAIADAEPDPVTLTASAVPVEPPVGPAAAG
jgi:hypothetical protein